MTGFLLPAPQRDDGSVRTLLDLNSRRSRSDNPFQNPNYEYGMIAPVRRRTGIDIDELSTDPNPLEWAVPGIVSQFASVVPKGSEMMLGKRPVVPVEVGEMALDWTPGGLLTRMPRHALGAGALLGPKSTPEAAPPFHSAAERAAENMSQQSGTGEQMLSIIMNTPGVKAEEIKWLGLDEFLAGRPSVTQREIVDFVNANKLKIEEVTKRGDGDGDGDVLEWGEGTVDDSYEVVSFEAERIADDIDYYAEDVLVQMRKNSPAKYSEADNVWVNEVRSQIDEGGITNLDKKYRWDFENAIDDIAKEDYLEGSPYKEWVDAGGHYTIYGSDDIGYSVTRNSDGRTVSDGDVYNLEEAKIQAYSDALDYGYLGSPGDTRWGEYTLPGGKNYREVLLTLPDRSLPPELQGDAFAKAHGYELDKVLKVNTPEGEHWQRAIREAGQSNDQRNFISGHYDEPNVLAHVRMNDRTGPGGKRILFVEEVQSDWHQKGRKQGYAQPQRKLISEAQERISKAETEVKAAREGVVSAIREREGANADVIWDTVQKLSMPQLENYARRSGINFEPIKKYSDAVFEMHDARKQLQDFERGMTPSGVVPDAPLKKTWHETSLRRILRMAADEGYDSVAWTPGRVQAERYDLSKQISEIHLSGTNFKAYGLNGEEVISRTGVKPEDLPELIGKEAADRLMSQEAKNGLRSLTGQELEVGGEGMKGFYDKMLKKYAEKFGKKFGAKVGVTKVAGEEVWTIPITDKMKKVLREEGVSMFSAGVPTGLLGPKPEERDQFESFVSPRNRKILSNRSGLFDLPYRGGII